jgi:hypothetical protein
MTTKRVFRWGWVAVLILVSGWPSSLAQPNAFSYWIDPGLEPALRELPGVGGGSTRPLGAVLDPDGVQVDFVVTQVILHGPSPVQLDNFIGAYAAEIVFGEDLPGDPGNLPPDKLRPAYSTTDDYLLQVNLELADLSEFELWMGQLGYDGEYVFSSDEAVRAVAIVAKERAVNDLDASINILMTPPPQPDPVDGQEQWALQTGADATPTSANCVMCSTEEYTVTGGYANSFGFSWLNDADLKATRAWQYYDLLEYTPGSYPVLAMVDCGFALNADFPSNVPQYDFETESYTTSGNANTLPSGGRWHGTGTLGLAAARLNNRFGTAGTGGQVAFPYLFRPEGTLYGVALAIRTAVYWGADVVNVSAAAGGSSVFSWMALAKAANEANSAGVIVTVTAGNNGGDASNYYPCAVPGFLCVGGINMSTKQAHADSNHGSKIEVWGPYNGLQTTPNPDSGGSLVGFGGTCGASAYVAGVVTLMKAVSPTLDYAGAAALLKSTANTSSDPKLAGAGGYLNAYGAVKASANSAGLQAQDDAYEPNDTPAAAVTLTPGTRTATIAPADTDYFVFVTTDLMDVQLRVAYNDRTSPGNGLNARLDGTWGTDSGGTITLDQAYLPPGTHVLEIYGYSVATLNCYQIDFSLAFSSVAPDAYDDQTPSGEPRNDTFANRAVIPGTVQASVLVPMGQITDLSFDTVGDIDFFEVTLAPETDPSSGHTECIGPGDPHYGDPGFSQGRLEISAWPDGWKPGAPGYNWPFELKVYNGSGSTFASTTGLKLSFECPHQQFPDGKIRFSVKAQDGRRNFYRVFIHYFRWDVYYDIPIWVWTQTEPPFLRVLPPYAGWVEQMYPRDPEVIGQWVGGTPPDPMPPDYAAFYWDEVGDLDLSLLTQSGHFMNVMLYNAEHEIVAEAAANDAAFSRDRFAIGDGAYIHVPDLEPGTYVLAFSGDFGTVYSVSVGAPFFTYTPLALRDFE